MGYEPDITIIYAHKPDINLEFGDSVLAHEYAASHIETTRW